jgi:hypothetical protein
MLRRLFAVGFAAAIAAPLLSATPASATVLFSCTNASGSATLTPGLSNTPTHQTDVSAVASISGCSNGETGSVGIGSGSGHSTVASVANANGNLSCLGNPPNNTPIIVGLTDPSFDIAWTLGGPGSSTGITKIKGSGAVARSKAVLVLTAGRYTPAPAGQKTKLKVTFNFIPNNGVCNGQAGNTTSVNIAITPSTSLIVQQS